MKLLQIPEENRPRERFQKLGPAALSDAEILAIILQKGTVKANCDELGDYGYIAVEKIEKHPKTGRPSFSVSITEQGQEFLQKRKNKLGRMS